MQEEINMNLMRIQNKNMCRCSFNFRCSHCRQKNFASLPKIHTTKEMKQNKTKITCLHYGIIPTVRT
uniref:Uncharacterized protein n=1 Tax=Anguilla anguilla TaxID=7936 RepID=A0A0E9WY00_ANGAN